jgi:hypothetical protein
MGGVVRDWAKLGIKLHTTALPLSKLCCGWNNGTALSHGNFQLTGGEIYPSVDPDEWRIYLDSRNIDRDVAHHDATDTMYSGVRYNFAGVRDRVINRAFAAGLDPLHPDVRYRNYAAVQRRVNRRAYYFPVFYVAYPATVGDRAAHVVPGPDLGGALKPGYFWNIYDWRVKGQG